ncbi:MAG: hypothetical protein M3Q49_01230 [Actinomycetota bacterium]|nr:hypothetical protein [Actinomycetota bacterium]
MAVPAVALLVLCRALGLGRRDRLRIPPRLLLGWSGQTIADILAHVDDTGPLLWPISG